MRKILPSIIGIAAVLTSCVTSNYNAKQFAIQEGKKEDKKYYWDKYQSYVQTLEAKGIKDRNSVYSILGRPDTINELLGYGTFWYHGDCPTLNGLKVHYMIIGFDRFDMVKSISLNITELGDSFENLLGYSYQRDN